MSRWSTGLVDLDDDDDDDDDDCETQSPPESVGNGCDNHDELESVCDLQMARCSQVQGPGSQPQPSATLCTVAPASSAAASRPAAEGLQDQDDIINRFISECTDAEDVQQPQTPRQRQLQTFAAASAQPSESPVKEILFELASRSPVKELFDEALTALATDASAEGVASAAELASEGLRRALEDALTPEGRPALSQASRYDLCGEATARIVMDRPGRTVVVPPSAWRGMR